MATLVTTVDRTLGNYEDVFIYTLNASFNGVVGGVNSAEIRISFPNYLSVFLGDYKDPVESAEIIELPDGGTEVVYNFGSIEELGVAVRLGFGVQFKIGTENLSLFTCSSVMLINGETEITSQAPEIKLEAIADFEFRRQIILPSVDPSPGSEIYYRGSLQNFGDLGATLTNLTIVCQGSDNIEIDDSFEVVGFDASSKFPDTSSDGIIGIVENNTVTFTLTSYRGEKYEFIYRARVSEALPIGAEAVTEATWNADEIEVQTEFHDVTMGVQVFDGNITLYGPDYSLPNEYICYRMGLENVGNQVLTEVVFTNELPTQVDYYKFETGSFHIGAIKQNMSANYFIEFETQNGNSGTLGPYNTDINSTVDLSTLIVGGDTLSELRWNLTQMRVGVTSKASPTLYGIIKGDTAINSSLLNHIHLVFDDQGEQAERIQNFSTIIDDICVLRPSFSMSGGTNPVKPLDTVRMNLSFNGLSSRLKNPVVAMLMPKEFTYSGGASLSYSDVFGSISPTLPQVTVVEDFTADGSTLVKFEFSGDNAFSFRQLANVTVSFDAQVKVGAYGLTECFMVLNTDASTGIIPPAIDVYIDDDGISDLPLVSKTYAKSSTIEKRILFFVSIASNKKVKGALDSEFLEEPDVGSTYEGGKLQYVITLKNTGNADLLDAEVVDILPYIGDVGVIETGTLRESKFAVYSITEVSAKILPSGSSADIEVYYSTSVDPVRFGGNFDTIGTVDDWTTDLPEDLTTLRSFKVIAKDLLLKPSEVLEVTVNGIIPVGVGVGLVAWNSFAADVSYIDINDATQKLLAIEPEKVGISVVDTPEGTIEIGGNVWFDSDADGFYEAGHPFVNDAGVALLNEAGEMIDALFTAPSASGIDGQYLFANLPKGKYYVRFFIDDANFKLTKQQSAFDNGSKPDKSSGITDIIDMTESTSNRNVTAGIVAKGTYTLDEIMKVNKSARGMVRDVVKNQMLLVMKNEDILELIESENS